MGKNRKKPIKFRELSADRLKKAFAKARENDEALKKANKISPQTLKERVNTVLDPDVQEFVASMNNSLASLDDAKIVPQEIMNFEVTV